MMLNSEKEMQKSEENVCLVGQLIRPVGSGVSFKFLSADTRPNAAFLQSNM